MSSRPGKTVWQKDIFLPHLLTALTVPVPSTQLGLLGKGFLILPLLSQNRPPFFRVLAWSYNEFRIMLTMDSG